MKILLLLALCCCMGPSAADAHSTVYRSWNHHSSVLTIAELHWWASTLSPTPPKTSFGTMPPLLLPEQLTHMDQSDTPYHIMSHSIIKVYRTTEYPQIEGTYITKSSSRLRTAPPQFTPCVWEHCPNSPWTLTAQGFAHHTPVKNIVLIPNPILCWPFPSHLPQV